MTIVPAWRLCSSCPTHQAAEAASSNGMLMNNSAYAAALWPGVSMLSTQIQNAQPSAHSGGTMKRHRVLRHCSVIGRSLFDQRSATVSNEALDDIARLRIRIPLRFTNRPFGMQHSERNLGAPFRVFEMILIQMIGRQAPVAGPKRLVPGVPSSPASRRRSAP